MSRSFLLPYLSILVTLLFVAGCDGITDSSKPGARLRTELIRLGGPEGHQPTQVAKNLLLSRLPCNIDGSCADLISHDADDQDHEFTGLTSDIELLSFRAPITTIELQSSATDDAGNIYRCEDDCLVEFADDDFARNLLKSSVVEVPVGQYDRVIFGHCSEDATGFDMYVRATVEFNGVRYYTKSDGSLQPTAPAEDATLYSHGCGIESRMPFPVIVEESEIWQEIYADSIVEGEEDRWVPMGEATLRLYFTTENLVHAGQGWAGIGACSIYRDEDVSVIPPHVCAAAPNVAGFLGDLVPETEYYITDANAAFTLFTLDGRPMGGYVRYLADPLVVEDSGWSSLLLYTGSIDVVRPNDDGTVYLEGHMTDTDRPSFIIDRFVRGDHAGEWIDFDANTGRYNAKRLR